MSRVSEVSPTVLVKVKFSTIALTTSLAKTINYEHVHTLDQKILTLVKKKSHMCLRRDTRTPVATLL